MKKKINHYVAVPAGDSNSSQVRLAKCVRSMIKSEGDESKRAKKIVKMIATGHPDAFLSVLQENGHAPKGDGKMDDEAALTMTLESNVNCTQIRTINGHFKCAFGGGSRAKRRMLED